MMMDDELYYTFVTLVLRSLCPFGVRGVTIRSLLLSTFQKLQADGLEKDIARQYYESFCSFLSLHHQTGMKVWTHSSSEKINVDFEKLFEDIYAGKFEIKGTGDLRYKE